MKSEKADSFPIPTNLEQEEKHTRDNKYNTD